MDLSSTVTLGTEKSSRYREVDVVQRERKGAVLNKSQCMDCLPKKVAVCKEVTVVEGWPFVEVGLYTAEDLLI